MILRQQADGFACSILVTVASLHEAAEEKRQIALYGNSGTAMRSAFVVYDRIFTMRRAAKTLILVLLLAALPLRGYAGVLMAFCEANHGGAAAALEHAHHAGAEHHHDSDDSTPSLSHSASACSVCASCCASASLATGSKLAMTFSAPGTHRIPFFGGQVSGFVLDHLDRPPLPL